MPAAEVELDHGHESLHRVVNLGNGQEHLGMAHEAARRSNQHSVTIDGPSGGKQIGALCDPLEHASRLENERRQDYATEIGARSKQGNNMHKN